MSPPTRGMQVLACPALPGSCSFGNRARSHYPHGVVANRRDNLGDSEGGLVEVPGGAGSKEKNEFVLLTMSVYFTNEYTLKWVVLLLFTRNWDQMSW
ncbi:hypothetical protein NPIL_426791 [Nephila pilipes]|uniref:Uncharacterized protein n=1 Tax=Nephila pilipes TaxID=299642 RepID=A0A8X6UCR2_NEPPI|nr:hypothetical protein NPIL_426791 [Nephila pilipes]